MDIVTKHSFYIPRPLEPGVLHVSREFEMALPKRVLSRLLGRASGHSQKSTIGLRCRRR